MVDLIFAAKVLRFNADEMKGKIGILDWIYGTYVAPVSKSPNTHLELLCTHT